MASTSLDAAERINAIIDGARNLAQAQVDNFGGYANQGILATEGIVLLKDGGDVPASTFALTLPPLPVLPDPAGLSEDDYAESVSEITAALNAAFNSFYQTYFPNDVAQNAAAVQQLQNMVAQAQPAIASMLGRIGGDAAARAFLNGRLTKTVNAEARREVSIDAGNQGTGFSLGRLAASTPAANYLLARYAGGDQATTALITMITQGGTGIPASVENQIWARDRSRVIADANRAKQEAIDSWAARGFPLPTGGAQMATLMIDAGTQDKIAQSSRDRAIEDTKILIENVKFGANLILSDAAGSARAIFEDGSGVARVLIDDARAATQMVMEDAREAARILLEDGFRSTQALVQAAIEASQPLLKLRADAVQAATEYMRAIALAPQIGSDLAKTKIEAEARLAEITAQYFLARMQAVTANTNAQIAVADLQLKPAIVSAENRTRILIANNEGAIGIAEARSRAAQGAATAASNVASSALSTLNAVAALTQNS